MKQFNKEDKIRELLKAFEATDEFYAKFRTKFKLEMLMLFHKYHPNSKEDDIAEEIIETFANQIISTSESVLDKDNNYPDYRKKEELIGVERVVKKIKALEGVSDFIELSHAKAKELIVEFYPSIINLSGDGFRLLDQYVKMHHASFVVNIKNRDNYRDEE